MWIFGYGSLIFRPSFEYLERRRAFVRGWQRRFWQGSPDHRGVPEAPGRVATLIAMGSGVSPESGDDEAVCGGVAYRIDPEKAGEILPLLDHREVAGFVRHDLPLFEDPKRTSLIFATGITWVANDANAHFLGPLSEEEIARFVLTRRGPSGENREYVLLLAAALRELDIHDPHVESVARHLQDHLAAESELR